jgi:hypothetical protein
LDPLDLAELPSNKDWAWFFSVLLFYYERLIRWLILISTSSDGGLTGLTLK